VTIIDAAEPLARRRHPTAHRPTERRSATFVALLALIVSLNLLGLVMVLSASSVTALDEYGSSWYVAMRQGMWLLVGTTVMVLVMRADYHVWRRWATPLLGFAAFLLVLVLVPGIGMNINGASRWLGYGPFSLQPSELAKLAVLVFVADLLARRSAWISECRLTLVPVALVMGGFSFLLMLQPNLGTTIVLGVIVMAVLYVAGTRLAPLTALGAAGIAAATVLALGASYRRARVLAFLDPWEDPLNTGYQNIQSLVGLASGGLTGTGLGASRAKWGFLPYAHTDFIFSIIGEELGLLGALGVVALFLAVGVLGIRAALCAPDRFGTLLAAGVSTWFLAQAFVNIGAVVGILPITGVPLPFVSYGGSSLVFAMAGAGLLLSVARHARPRDRRAPARASARR
jgi:cell division protein FtsW